VHADWTLRVPVVRPRGAAWIDGAVTGAVGVAVAFALYCQAFASALLAGLCGAALAGALVRARRRPPVTALRMTRDGAFYVRLREGWRPVDWVARWRGPRWLTLRASLPGAFCNGPGRSRRHVTFTVWQDGLPPPAWRRVCLLTNRRLCRSPGRRAAGTS
jgi:hypothetical protein